MINWIKETLNRWQEDEEREKKRLYGGSLEKFQRAMSLLDFCSDDQEKLDSIEAITDMIINEIKYDYMNCYIYNSQKDLSTYKSFFPQGTWDENGDNIECRYALKKKRLNLAQDRIISGPWSREKAIRNILNLKDKDFVFREKNHLGVYYRPFDICQVSNGNHSVMASIAHKKQGELLIEEVDISPIFPYVDTDGMKWIHKYREWYHDSVMDYRLAVIYKMYKVKYELLD